MHIVLNAIYQINDFVEARNLLISACHSVTWDGESHFESYLII